MVHMRIAMVHMKLQWCTYIRANLDMCTTTYAIVTNCHDAHNPHELTNCHASQVYTYICANIHTYTTMYIIIMTYRDAHDIHELARCHASQRCQESKNDSSIHIWERRRTQKSRTATLHTLLTSCHDAHHNHKLPHCTRTHPLPRIAMVSWIKKKNPKMNAIYAYVTDDAHNSHELPHRTQYTRAYPLPRIARVSRIKKRMRLVTILKSQLYNHWIYCKWVTLFKRFSNASSIQDGQDS